MELKASGLRKRMLKMAYECGRSVHIGGSMSMAEVLTVLYGEILNYKKEDPFWSERDRFFLSKGHCALALYAVLTETGFISEDEIKSFMQDGSSFGSHPVMDVAHGIECSSGSLGQGVSMALGVAKAAKILEKGYKVYALVGNGECDEGSVWESFMLAGQWKLDNLTVIIDNNGLQSDGESSNIINTDNLKDKLSGFDLDVIDVNGHDEEELRNVFLRETVNKTKVVICNTVKGRGVSFMENNNEWHHNRLTKELFDKAVMEI